MHLMQINITSANFLIMGLTFKENCNDIRNSKVFKIIDTFKSKKINYEIYDPYVDKVHMNKNIVNKLIKYPRSKKYDVILIAVAHSHFRKLRFKKISNFAKDKNIIFDIKNIFPKETLLRI